MSMTIRSSAHPDWTGEAQATVGAPGSQRGIGLLLMCLSAGIMIYALWAIGGVVWRLFAH